MMPAVGSHNRVVFLVVARLLGLLLLVGLGWLIVRQLLGRSTRRRDPPPPARFEKTLQCERCGVHLPLSLVSRDRDNRVVCNEPDCINRDRPASDRCR